MYLLRTLDFNIERLPWEPKDIASRNLGIAKALTDKFGKY